MSAPSLSTFSTCHAFTSPPLLPVLGSSFAAQDHGRNLLTMQRQQKQGASQQLAGGQSARTTGKRRTCPRVRHLVTGTFNTPYLHVLAYDTIQEHLSVVKTIRAWGPHQFLAVGRSSKAALSHEAEPAPDLLFATTWAMPPRLSAWRISGLEDSAPQGAEVDLQWINSEFITATSSYVHVQPPPFASLTTPSYGVEPANGGVTSFLYSAGGPTGEVHAIDPDTGALVSHAREGDTEPHRPMQELNFMRDQSTEALAKAEKTRKALRYGAHSVDVGVGNLAYVADLGRDAVLVYEVLGGSEQGKLRLLGETPASRAGDGPRHVVPSPDGRFVISVTEHTSYVDVWELDQQAIQALRARVASGETAVPSSELQPLRHVQSLDLLPVGADRRYYRGDTVRLSPDGKAILASTRGKFVATKGIVRAWALREPTDASSEEPVLEDPLFTYVTPTSGGKANAIEFGQTYVDPEADQAISETSSSLVVLTDDEEGLVLVLEWDGKQLVEKASTKLPAKGWRELGEGTEEGASHAVWLT